MRILTRAPLQKAMLSGAAARRHGSFRLPSFVCREYQVISDYSDTSNDESRSTGVTNPRGALHPRPGSFRRSHDAVRRARSRMSLRSIDSRRVGREREGSPARCVSNHTKRGEMGASGDGKLMGPRGARRASAFQKGSFSARDVGHQPRRFTKIHRVARYFNGREGKPTAFYPRCRDWGKMVSETDSS